MINFGLLKLVRDGAKGSGHFKHKARPGQVGGSVKSGASLTDVDEYLSKVGVKKGDVVKVFGLRKDVLLNHIENCLNAGDEWWGGVFKSQEDVDKARQLKADMEASGVSKDDKAYIKISRALARFDFVKGGAEFIKGKIAESQGVEPEDVQLENEPSPESTAEVPPEPVPEPIQKEPEVETKEVPFSLQFNGAGDVNKFMSNTIKNLNVNYTNNDLIMSSLHHQKERVEWFKENGKNLLDLIRRRKNNQSFFKKYMDLGSGRLNTFQLFTDMASEQNRFLGLFERYLQTGNSDLNANLVSSYANWDLLKKFAQSTGEAFKRWRLEENQFETNDYGQMFISEEGVKNELVFIKNWFNDLGIADAGATISKQIELETNLDNVPTQNLKLIGYFGKAFESHGKQLMMLNDKPTNSKALILDDKKGLSKKGLNAVNSLLNKDGSFDLSKIDDEGLLKALKMAYVPNLDKAGIKFDAKNCYEGYKLLKAIDSDLINFRDLPAYDKNQAEKIAQLLLSGYIYKQATRKMMEKAGGVKSVGTSKVTTNKKENEALFNEIRGLGGENEFDPFNWKPDKSDFRDFLNLDRAEQLLHVNWDETTAASRHPTDLIKSIEANWNSVTKLQALDSEHGETLDELKEKAKAWLNSGNLDTEGKGVALARRIDLYNQIKSAMGNILSEAYKSVGKIKKRQFTKDDERKVFEIAEDLIGLAYGDPNDPRLEKKRMDNLKKLMAKNDADGKFYKTLCKSLLRSIGVTEASNPELLTGSNTKQQLYVLNAFEKASQLGDIDNEYVNSKVEHEINRSENTSLLGKVFKQFKNVSKIFSKGERGSVGYTSKSMQELSKKWQMTSLHIDVTKRSDKNMFNEEDLNKLLCMMTVNGGLYNRIKESNQFGARNLVASACACAPKANEVVYRFENMSDGYRDYSKIKVGDTLMLDGQHFTQGESFKQQAAEYFGEKDPIGFKIEGGNCPFLNLEPHVWKNESGHLKNVQEVEGLVAGFTKVKAITPETIEISRGRKVTMNMVTLEYDWDAIKKFIQLNARDYANVYKMYGKEDDE